MRIRMEEEARGQDTLMQSPESSAQPSQQRVSHRKNKLTPFEVRRGYKPKLGYPRVWGYLAYVRLTNPKVPKLGVKVTTCTFLGYSSNSRAYSIHLFPVENDNDVINQKEYASLIANLRYATDCTRPDIAYATGVLSRFTSKPGESYSTTDYIFILGGAVFCWKSKKQTIIANYTMEAELIALASACEEANCLARERGLEHRGGWVKALTHGLAPLVVEVDATTVISLLQSRASGKWEVQHMIMRIVCLQRLLVADVQHVFREANGAADHLAKEAASLQLTRVLHHDISRESSAAFFALTDRESPTFAEGDDGFKLWPSSFFEEIL
ncbi:UNVERIFIED_CONTAM: Retrovirus-related Pol polyprotein from transposon TNT 1-94 [Sesamum calycinum]|uniref:Retrovirus-related Pol polyprotein from transposon TNT 1-94 n=1 Tax=Sesamum calycinum TaxID=2727403 RepID=A0AAW2J8Z2_9LAMI